MTQVVAVIHREAGVYGISFPDLPGCISTGTTLDEVVARGQEALNFHVEGMIEDRTPMPHLRSLEDIRHDPRYADDVEITFAVVPATLPTKAKRINITIDESLLDAIDRAANASGATRSGFLADAARQRLGR